MNINTMSDTFFRFADIEFGNSPTNESIVGLFRFEGAKMGKQGPYQVVVAEIDSALYAYEQLLDVINATVEQSRTLMTGMTLDPFARFEKLIARVNEAIIAFQEKEPTPINWNRINIFIIECNQDQLCISGHGKLTNIFLQKTEQGFKSFDLCGSLEQPTTPDPNKIFGSLMCGDMKPGDIFFIGTNNFNRLKAQLNLKDRLSELPPVSAATEIKRQLEKEQVLEDFTAAVISAHAPEQSIVKKEPNKQKDKSSDSMQKLRDHEEQINQTLSPVLNPLKPRKKQEPNLEGNPSVPKPIASPLGAITKFLSSLKRNNDPTTSTKTALRAMNAGHRSALTTQRKIILGAVAVLILISIVGYASWSRNKRIAAEQASWETSYQQAMDLKTKAENDLLYAKDAQAKTSIEQSEQIINALDKSSDDRKNRTEQMLADISVIKDRLRKVVVASNIIELQSLPVTVADGQLKAPVLTKDAAYVVDNSDKTIYKINLSSREKTAIKLPDSATDIVAGALGELSVIFIDSEGSFYAVSIAQDTVKALNRINDIQVADLVIYANKAYVLDGNDGQIYRLTQSSAGFGNQSKYFSDGAPAILAGATGFAIDSNVYVAKPNGSINRFLSGEQEAFGLGSVDPQLASLSAVWTDADDPRILVTDPAQKRLLVYDKNGLLTAQITSVEFGTLRDISLRPQAQQALIVSSNRLLLVPLP
ncbi:hypothetical protein KKG46_04290 [Patescibacteria group bacterium]|nr:hypothetical protein [Patescibacteria group bacterium]